MGCGSGVLKCILIIINILFAIIGMLFLGVGIYLEYFASDTLNSMFADIISNVPGLSSLANLSDASSSSGSLTIDFSKLLSPISIVLIVVGSLVAGIALIGCIGTCCNNRCFIIIYCVLMAVILSAQVIMVGLFFGGVLKPRMESYIQGVIDNDYVGIDDTGLYSLAFNFVMVEGCWNACSTRLNTHRAIAIGALAGVLAVQFIILLFGICIARSVVNNSEDF